MSLRPKQFQTLVLRWFDRHGRKHLPWQHNKTPYRVWISEIMLQQTQVNTVIPYFERFMQQFPNLAALAKADEDAVLHLWAGLGYYSRARNLHRAAKMVMSEFKGQLPGDLEALQELPGIGQSTAGAILSIAFEQPAAILDGNVKRVLARLHGITQPVNEKNTHHALWDLATQYVPTQRVADYTQAMMDLGATLCTRGKPQCDACPLIKHCWAYQHDMTDKLPVSKKARELPVRAATFFVLQKDESFLLQKRPATGIWGGLWSFPELPGTPDERKIQQFCRDHFQLSVTNYQSLPSFRHTFTHYHLEIHPILITVKRARKRDIAASQQIWYNPLQPDSVGLPKPVQSIVRKLV